MENETTPATKPDQAGAAAVLAGEIAKAIAPVAAEMKSLRDELSKRKSTSYMDGLPSSGVSEVKEVEPPAGVRAARVIKAHMVARMSGGQVGDVLQGWGYASEAKAMERTVAEISQKRALGMGAFADGGALVPVEYSNDMIKLLRNKTAVRKMGARAIQIGAALNLPEQTQAATAQWVGEGQAIVPSQQRVGGQMLSPKKLAAIVPISNDLIRNASIGAEEFVRDDMVQVMGLKEDLTFLFGVGGEFSPRGLTSLTATANQYAATASAPKAPTLAEVKTELANAKAKLMGANIPMTRLGWILSPRTWQYLYAITDGNGNSVYSAQLDAGMLAGAPYIVTNQIPENLGGSADESRIFFGDFDQLVIAESSVLPLTVEVFPNATYDSTGSGNIVSGISNDQSVIRGLQAEDFGMRYRAAFVVVAVRWGAP